MLGENDATTSRPHYTRCVAAPSMNKTLLGEARKLNIACTACSPTSPSTEKPVAKCRTLQESLLEFPKIKPLDSITQTSAPPTQQAPCSHQTSICRRHPCELRSR